MPTTPTDVHPAIARFVAIVSEYPPGPGLGEYLLWEFIEGKRPKPFPFFDPLTQEDVAALATLRDQLQVWPFFQEAENTWMLSPVDAWREYARTTDYKRVVQSKQFANA